MTAGGSYLVGWLLARLTDTELEVEVGRLDGAYWAPSPPRTEAAAIARDELTRRNRSTP